MHGTLMFSRSIAFCLAMLGVCGVLLADTTSASACGPGQYIYLDSIVPNGTILPSEPELLIMIVESADLEPANFTLTDEDGVSYPVTATHTGVRFGGLNWVASVRPDHPLPAGKYLLAYKGGFIISTDGTYHELEDELTFEVDPTRPVVDKLSFGVRWYRHKLPENRAPQHDSCGGSNFEHHRFHVDVPEMCQDHVGQLFLITEIFSDFHTPRKHIAPLRDISADIDIIPELGTHVAFRGSRESHNIPCFTFTLRSVEGFESEPRTLCSPTYCSVGTEPPLTIDGYTPCANDSGEENELRLHSTLCPLSSGTGDCQDITCPEQHTCDMGHCIPDDPCQGSLCSGREVCEEGSCVYHDPCEDVVCEEGWTCGEGHCFPPPDPCAGIVCEGTHHCVNARCVAMEMKPDDSPVEEPTLGEETDPCEGVVCSQDQVCLGGYCIERGESDPPPAMMEDPGEDEIDERGCQVAPGSSPGAPLGGVWILGLLLVGRTSRHKQREQR